MQVDSQSWGPGQANRWPLPADEKLERALVAGLILEAILEEPKVSLDSRIRSRRIKSRVLYALTASLAGRITLDRFRNLVQRLEQWFPFYYPLMPPMEPPLKPPSACRATDGGHAGPELVHRDRLRQWLAKDGKDILPQRPQRKIEPDRLEEALWLTRGLWFRVKDLAQAFDIDRKTAWEYLQKLQDAGLLVHNGSRSAAVRYRLADYFLQVKVAALERQVSRTLPRLLPHTLMEQITTSLAASGGQPFWEHRWLARLAGSRREEISASLQNAGILEVVCLTGRDRLLRLQSQWLSSH